VLTAAVTILVAACGSVTAYHEAHRLNREVLQLTQAGRLKEATVVAERVLQELRAALGDDDREVVRALAGLARLYQSQHEYDRAEVLYRRAIETQRKLSGPLHLEVANRLSDLAALHRDRHQYDRAAPLQREALTIREKISGPIHPEVATAATALALSEQMLGRYAESEALLQRALAIRHRVHGADSLEVATTLGDLADLSDAQGHLQKAVAIQRRVLPILEKVLDANDPFIASFLSLLAARYEASGQYSEAEPLHHHALAILERSLGADHPEVAAALGNLAVFHWAAGDAARALATQERTVAVREQALSLMLDTGSEEHKQTLLAGLEGETRATLSLHADALPNDPRALRLAVETVLRRKGRVLDVMTHNLRAAAHEVAGEARKLFEDWKTARTSYAELALTGAPPGAGDLHRARLIELAARIAELEAEIAAHNPEFQPSAQAVTIDRVQRALPPDAALVEFVSAPRFDPRGPTPERRWGPARYLAYVIFSDGAPRWIDLGDAASIDEEVVRFRDALTNPERDAAPVARALDERIMRPVRRLIGNRRMLLISPDGALNLIPFAALVDEAGRPLVESYTIGYLTSGRDLLRPAGRPPARQATVVVANPDFNFQAVKAVTAPESSALPPSPGVRGRAGLAWAPLPGTAGEARALAELLPSATILTGAAATESALKAVHGPSILHVATHGHFDSGSAGSAGFMPATRSGRVLRSTNQPVERASSPSANPLLHAWLVLAGGNASPGGGDDGILTALEAAALDLRGTQIVVLSACETGVGTVRAGEGVYGLRRAFVMAGAESQVVSLWKVEDQATRDLMVAMYRRLLAGTGRLEALRQAQLELLGSAERKHPFFWSSFIGIGEWTPLRER
jgi:CHAT domain-containing protein